MSPFPQSWYLRRHDCASQTFGGAPSVRGSRCRGRRLVRFDRFSRLSGDEEDTGESEVKRALIEIMDWVVLLADSKKFEGTAIARLGLPSDVDFALADERGAPPAAETVEVSWHPRRHCGDTGETSGPDLLTREEQME